MGKKPWQSKTMLVNGVLGALTFAGLFIPGMDGVKVFIDAHGAEIAMVWSLLNIALRTVTKEAIVLGE